MAESTLTLSWTEFQAEVGYFLGYGYTEANWSAAQLAEIGRYVQSGIRQVIFPASQDPNDRGYEWSFMSPTTTITFSDGTWEYDLPDDFSSLSGNLYFPDDEYRQQVVEVPEGRILQLRVIDDREGYPEFFATRPKSSDQTDGQRWELIIWPTADDTYVMRYTYEAYTGSLTDTRLYPLGGMKLSELYKESCLATAEQIANDSAGIHTQKFNALLADAIARDRKQSPRYLGRIGHTEDIDFVWRRGYTGGTYPITYNGTPIP